MSVAAIPEIVTLDLTDQAELEEPACSFSHDDGGQEWPCSKSLNDTSPGEQESSVRHAGVALDSSLGCPDYTCAPCADDRDLWFYRDRTIALLRRYGRMAVETGRLPSVIGREFFRVKVTPYAMASFEDMVIFVHDMETSFDKLNAWQRQLIALNVLEEYSYCEIAEMMGCTRRWLEWEVPEAIDALTAVLLGKGVLTMRSKGCQGGKKTPSLASDSKKGKNIF